MPGYHGKGLYSGQGLLIYANNGDQARQAFVDPSAPSGCLAVWDGKAAAWTVVRRNQFTDVTGPGGILGNPNPETDPVWAIGWDHRSLLLTVLDRGAWHTYRLPKGSHSYDGGHGWNTEWPRIREIGGKSFLMTMHGTFWRFPKTFSARDSAGIAPLSNYLKVVADFCRWGDWLVLACDDSAKSEFLNKRRAKGTIRGPGQSHSNLWFVNPERLVRGLVRPSAAVRVLGDRFRGGSERSVSVSPGMRSARSARTQCETRCAHPRNGCAGKGVWNAVERSERHRGAADGPDLRGRERGAWVRLVPQRDAADVYACFQYANPDRRSDRPDARCAGLASLRDPRAYGGIVYARGGDKRVLGLAAVTAGPAVCVKPDITN